LKSLSSFLIKNQLDKAIVTTIDITNEIEFDKYTLDYVPASIYCYAIGKRTLE